MNDLRAVNGPGSRVAVALSEYMQYRAKEYLANRMHGVMTADPGFVSLKHAIVFRKCVENGAFENSPQIFAQLKGVGPATARSTLKHNTQQISIHSFSPLLVAFRSRLFFSLFVFPLPSSVFPSFRKLWSHAHSFTSLSYATDDTLAAWCGKRVPNLTSQLSQIPRFVIRATHLGNIAATGGARVQFNFSINNPIRNPDAITVHIIVGTLRNQLLYYETKKGSQLPLQLDLDPPVGSQVRAFIIDEKTGQSHTHSCIAQLHRYSAFSRLSAHLTCAAH